MIAVLLPFSWLKSILLIFFAIYFQGNISKWHKQVGDEIGPGDVLAAIETDKAVVDFEMQEEGYVGALLYPEGARDVDLGKVVAILVEE